MYGKKKVAVSGCVVVLLLGGAACFGQGGASAASAVSASIAPGTMTRIGAIDERFQSYNIEAVEVTGGRFWKPFAKAGDVAPAAEKPASAMTAPGGMDPSLYEYRAPIDLSNKRLRKLAAALGPAYVRVSGTWMNSTYFQDSDAPAPTAAPKGFNSVLTRAEWKGVVDFSHAVDAGIVTSFATSAGTRDEAGVWTPEQAKKLMDYTKSVGGHIAAAEFMNEPTFAEMGGAPKGYDAPAYAKDFAVFKKFVQSDAVGMVVLGPGGVGEGSALAPSFMHLVKTEDILAATGPAFDAYSYHSYGGVSSRCGGMGAPATSPEAALSEEWLARGGKIEAYYAAIRDRLMPGKAIWLTETAEAACGGDRWASDFIDSFRYLNQLGSLAKSGVQVHMHNTLASSDYGLLDQKTLEPRPNYWAAVLWRRLMGTTVLDPGTSPAESLHLFAQCMRGKPGGVTLLAINLDKSATQTMAIPTGAERYTLTSADLLSASVELNGSELKLGAGDALPAIKGAAVRAGQVTFAPESITFLALPMADNVSCK
jgi:heparanase 1